MLVRIRAVTGAVLATALLLSSAAPALAAPSPERIKAMRADTLASRRVLSSTAQFTSAETTIAVLGTAWYKDVNGVQHFDGYFGNGGGTMFQDAWVMVNFKDAMGMTVGTEEVMANEYVVEGQGSWSAKFTKVPADATGAEAMVYGTPTTRMAFAPTGVTSPTTHILAGTDRHFEGTATFGMLGMTSDPTLADLVVSIAEDHMGTFHDVAVGGVTSTTTNKLLPGVGAPWLAWAPRPADMTTDVRFVNYSAVEFSTIAAKASTKVPAYGATVWFTGSVRDSAGMAVAGAPVVAFTPTGAIAGRATTRLDGTYTIGLKPSVKTTYTIVSLGTSYVASASSAPVTIDPKVYVSAPSAPSSVYRNRYCTSTGYLKPRHTAGTYPVVIKAYRKVSGVWVLKKTIKAKASNYYSYSKYTARYYLPTRGYWKLVATHDSAVHYPSISSARLLTVK